jgi:dolichyl-phosphate-mannose--protein O-mannosyl transferase
VEKPDLYVQLHSKLVDTHPYSAAWYTWPFDIRPILYYLSDQGSLKSAFGAFGNPFVWWGGLACLGLIVWRFIKRREPAALFILIGYLSQMLPWVLVPRLTFIYHYFPSTVFLCLALGYVFNDFVERERRAAGLSMRTPPWPCAPSFCSTRCSRASRYPPGTPPI